jgi:aryl sulfotransferase
MITWLASYPKSGNTWLRTLLTNYLRDADAPADINALEGGPIASARLWFDEWTGVEASLLSDAVIERLRPEVYRCMVRENPQTLYMKTHDAWKRTDRDEPLFPPDVTAGVVYILRNPLDVSMSWANHNGIDAEKSVQNLCDPKFELARTLDGLADQLRQYMGSWSSHIHSWVDDSGLPVHIIRYEDLRHDPESVFSETLRFCGLPLDSARIKKAVEFSSFSELQKQEREKGFRERPTKASGGFFRQGKVGGWREELSPEQVKRMIAAFGDTMYRFGYLNEDKLPI